MVINGLINTDVGYLKPDLIRESRTSNLDVSSLGSTLIIAQPVLSIDYQTSKFLIQFIYLIVLIIIFVNHQSVNVGQTDKSECKYLCSNPNGLLIATECLQLEVRKGRGDDYLWSKCRSLKNLSAVEANTNEKTSML